MAKRGKSTAYRTRLHKVQGVRLPALCLSFLMGVLLGYVGARFLGFDSELASYLLSIASLDPLDDVVKPSVLQILAAYFRYPLLVLLLGYCSCGVVAVSFLLLLQGFTFAFATASLTASLGLTGAFLALASFGVRFSITVVSTLFLARCLFERSESSNEKSKSKKSIALCFLLLVFGIILEFTVVPRLFSLALLSLK